MFVRFQDNLPTAQRGDEVTFGCFIDNTLTANADVTYVVESDPPANWGVLGPPQLPAQSTTPHGAPDCATGSSSQSDNDYSRRHRSLA